MKIIALQAENIKRIVAAEIRPRPGEAVVQITGRNGQGKTSILDSILWGLGGKEGIQMAPVRRGCERGRITLDLGTIIVTRTFKAEEEGGTTTALKVESAEGAKFNSPQAMLDRLLSTMAFDPLAFARAPAKEQFETLRRFVPSVDFDRIDGLNRADFDRRTDLNRQVKALRARIEAIPVPPLAPETPVDEDAITRRLAEAAEFNADIETRRGNRARLGATINGKMTEAARLRDEADALRKRAEALDLEAGALEGEARMEQDRLDSAGDLPTPIDVAKLEEEAHQARRINAVYRQVQERRRLEGEAQALASQAEALTKSIAEREEAKRQAIAAAAMPVPGLGFGDGCVTLGGVPFDQASDAEQLRASIAIAMAGNPELRVVRVRDGSLLDDRSMEVLESMARERDFQVWIERVDGSGTVGFVMEEGRVREAEVAA